MTHSVMKSMHWVRNHAKERKKREQQQPPNTLNTCRNALLWALAH